MFNLSCIYIAYNVSLTWLCKDYYMTCGDAAPSLLLGSVLSEYYMSCMDWFVISIEL